MTDLRAFVLETAESRTFTVDAATERDAGPLVIQSNRVVPGIGETVTLLWSDDDADFHAFLLEHYRENRNERFLVDMSDGQGPVGYQYASPPRMSHSAPRGHGTYSVTLERDSLT